MAVSGDVAAADCPGTRRTPMRVLVTGSSGRIGGAIRRRLALHHRVTGIDRVPGPATDRLADIEDRKALRALLAGHDAVIHCAALHAPHVGHASEAHFLRINVEATASLADLAGEAGVGHFLFASTTALYGAGNAGPGCLWIDEDTVPAPKTIYHQTKLAAERQLASRAGFGLPVTVLRIGRCFPEPVDTMAVYRLHRGLALADCAAAFECALAHVPDGMETALLSGPTPFLPEDCVDLALNAEPVIRRRAPDVALAFDRLGWRLPERIDRVYDPAFAMRRLGWTPSGTAAALIAGWEAGGSEAKDPER